MTARPSLNPIDLILKKRDGGNLTRTEIAGFVDGVTSGDIPDYQAAAFLMASYLNGMNGEEMVGLTHCMLHSGSVLDLSDIPGRKVDKHSTGGVGDKMSIILAPIVASCGVPVPMISGRGLGHTGGTLDKLESIPGFSTQMSIASYRQQLAEIGVVMIGQTDDIAPADKKLYALRDVTATVEFIPFIAASILSKKLAEGIDALVLDVKFGSGAFMQSETQARKLAQTLTDLGEQFGKRTVALLTDMNQPLGFAIGNWPEIAESIDCLHGKGPEDVMEVTLALSAEMIVAGGKASSLEEGLRMAEASISSGRAWAKFEELVARQGGQLESIQDPAVRTKGQAMQDIHAQQSGTISHIDARIVGRAAVSLGAGRVKKEDVVDPRAGIILSVSAGSEVQVGDVIAQLVASTSDRFEQAASLLSTAFEIGSEREIGTSRIKDRYSDGKWLNP
ncbi:thymidine phosphorylase [bacterium]|nr:thymidine phosphorylase [bacterium]